MEKEGLRRSVELYKLNDIRVNSIVTDRHVMINKWIRESMPGTKHYFDVWHVGKGTYFIMVKEHTIVKVPVLGHVPWSRDYI